jgi:hypothetical protein
MKGNLYMETNIEIGVKYISANISYFNVLDKYMIGLTIGGLYTILNNKFNTEQEAIKFLNDNIY